MIRMRWSLIVEFPHFSHLSSLMLMYLLITNCSGSWFSFFALRSFPVIVVLPNEGEENINMEVINNQLEFGKCRLGIVDLVAEVGSKVEKFKVGDKVGVGVMVGSCCSCNRYTENLENYCRKAFIPTYNGTYFDGTRTYGGYSDIIVVNEHFKFAGRKTFLLMLELLYYVLV
ncbi:hypothetical protein ACH5RR_012093 [Cinchona calisaya]|uniref:Alcohol dehydrogenase-like N-terminal domain-containing protein n=1 Tax=Cinchona calisaya TaxID=153742 RepID=A0ABD3A9C4_9GENT